MREVSIRSRSECPTVSTRKGVDVSFALGEVPASGAPSDVVRGVREVSDAGADMVLLNPVGATVAADRKHLERLAADVIPQLR
jgi:hypothetical protein